MQRPLAFLNGQLVPAADAVVSIGDAGFTMGVTVSEQLRTFGGKLFRVEQHLDRLRQSLAIVGLQLPLREADWLHATAEVAATNFALVAPHGDLGQGWFVTPGTHTAIGGEQRHGPTFGIYTYPLSFAWREKYTAGDHLVVSPVRQVPGDCWPAELKCRSRMHYYLAEREVQQRFPDARPLLLDAAGNVAETPTANVVMVRDRTTLVTPPRSTVLPGISLAVVAELAAGLGLPWVEEPLAPQQLAAADELLITSTPFCLLPVTRFHGRPIGNGQAGPVAEKLLAAWSQQVGLDIVGQAKGG